MLTIPQIQLIQNCADSHKIKDDIKSYSVEWIFLHRVRFLEPDVKSQNGHQDSKTQFMCISDERKWTDYSMKCIFLDMMTDSSCLVEQIKWRCALSMQTQSCVCLYVWNILQFNRHLPGYIFSPSYLYYSWSIFKLTASNIWRFIIIEHGP